MNKFDMSKIQPEILGESQKGQDSLIEYVFKNIGTTNKYYVEFGALDGRLWSNTHYLRNSHGWGGLLLDGGYENKEINLHKRFLTKDNVVNIFQEFDVPKSFDFLSIDIDGMDYWILKEILAHYSPRVIMTEVNSRFNPNIDIVPVYKEDFVWDKTWWGASPRATAKMARKFGYESVFVALDDMFLINKVDLLKNNIPTPKWEEVYPRAVPEIYNGHVCFDAGVDIWESPE